ncbi:MAG: hypothetical protein ACRD5H_17615, partial [Nitrososphaerales archaeon]
MPASTKRISVSLTFPFVAPPAGPFERWNTAAPFGAMHSLSFARTPEFYAVLDWEATMQGGRKVVRVRKLGVTQLILAIYF